MDLRYDIISGFYRNSPGAEINNGRQTQGIHIYSSKQQAILPHHSILHNFYFRRSPGCKTTNLLPINCIGQWYGLNLGSA